MRWLAIAGIVAPIWFVLVVIVQGLLQPDYSHVAMPISALAAWPYGWMQRLNFHVLGAARGGGAAAAPRAAGVVPCVVVLSARLLSATRAGSGAAPRSPRR